VRGADCYDLNAIAYDNGYEFGRTIEKAGD
jgi:hypothetical protein